MLPPDHVVEPAQVVPGGAAGDGARRVQRAERPALRAVGEAAHATEIELAGCVQHHAVADHDRADVRVIEQLVEEMCRELDGEAPVDDGWPGDRGVDDDHHLRPPGRARAGVLDQVEERLSAKEALAFEWVGRAVLWCAIGEQPLDRGVQPAGELEAGLRVEPAGEAPHALVVEPGAQPRRASLAFEASDAVVGLESPDLGLQRPVELGWGGLGGPGHHPVGPLRQLESLGGFEAPERTAHDIDMGTRDGAGIQRVTKPSYGLGRAGAGEDPLGLTQRCAAGLGHGLLGPGGGVGQLGREGDLATLQPRSQPRQVADGGRERGAVSAARVHRVDDLDEPHDLRPVHVGERRRTYVRSSRGSSRSRVADASRAGHDQVGRQAEEQPVGGDVGASVEGGGQSVGIGQHAEGGVEDDVALVGDERLTVGTCPQRGHPTE